MLPVHARLSPVNVGDVHDHINHVAAQLVRLHVHGRAVCGHVDLTEHVKQKRLLDPRVLLSHKTHPVQQEKTKFSTA